MPLHPEIKNYLESVPTSPHGYVSTLQEQRNALNSNIMLIEKRLPVHLIEDRIIPGSDYDIPIRIYTPRGEGPFPLLVFFHGGAFMMGSIEGHDEKVRPLTVESGYKVISVEYRLAPEYPFPSALNDCYTATKWVTENAVNLEGDLTRLAVGGDSAGGNLAAAVTLMARDRKEFSISKQVLIYPVMDLDVSEFRYPSLIENGKGYGLDSENMNQTYSYYLGDRGNPNHPYISPIKAKDFNDLPSALVITAEYDPLRDEGELYAAKLQQAGIHVETKRYVGAIHGFLRSFTHLDEYKNVYRFIGSFLNK
ncbi:alpha/beta hydrolase [Priestia filamentosa]|uniref:alpha/beta hydrolase n=1 Tax=Priestia filamentosa TaxID=1402861 RepID=UPI00385798BC